MTKTEKLLAELIALPSVNPAYLPGEDNRAGERRIAEFLAATAARAGLDVEFQEVLPGRPNLFARLLPAGPVRTHIWLVPHMDTVNGLEQQFTPVKRDGRIFGRGACDTKGSVAAMLSTLCRLASSGPAPTHTEITFLGVVDEEHGQSGSRWVAKSGLKADLAIVGEPTRSRVVTAHKGSSWLRLETRGKSAHAARPELGRNAIHAMARVVEVLETQYRDKLARRRHPLLGPATISVGVISGGTQPNIVPDRCSVEVDRRTLPGETEAGLRREVSRFLRAHKLRASCSSSKLAPCLPLETDPRLPVVSHFLRSARQKKPAGVDYFCDASVLAHAGIPSVVFGPGDIAQAHTNDEWLSLSELEKATAILSRFLQTLP
jgi:acetylornithine deacetylase/succinyl-diaminopimelate desuccinylase family protein